MSASASPSRQPYLDQLESSVRDHLAGITRQANQLLTAASASLVAAANLLYEAKQIVGGSHWSQYVANELPTVEYTLANKLVRLVEQVNLRNIELASLESISHHILLDIGSADTPNSARDELLTRIARGELLDPKAAFDVVLDHRRTVRSTRAASRWTNENERTYLEVLRKLRHLRRDLETVPDSLPVVKAIAKAEELIADRVGRIEGARGSDAR